MRALAFGSSPSGSTTIVRRSFVGSVGLIAKHAAVPVQTLIIETDSPYLSKGWPLFRRPHLPITYRVRLGRRFDPPADVAAFMVALEQEYVQQLSGAQHGELVAAQAAEQAGDCVR